MRAWDAQGEKMLMFIRSTAVEILFHRGESFVPPRWNEIYPTVERFNQSNAFTSRIHLQELEELSLRFASLGVKGVKADTLVYDAEEYWL